MALQEITKLNLDSLLRSISVAEAQMLGKLYKRWYDDVWKLGDEETVRKP